MEGEMRELQRHEDALKNPSAMNAALYRTAAAPAKQAGPGSQIFAVMGQPLKSKVGGSAIHQGN
jgi:hypothetical protein